jgi:NADH-quinone oxidoreductase subunit M
MFGMGIVSWLLVVPIIGALCIGALPGEGKATFNGARWIAFVTTIATFALSLEAWREFDPTIGGFQLLEQRVWLSQAISYKVGVDGVSLAFVLLTTFLMPFCIASSWVPIEMRVKEYMIAFLMLEALMIGVFVALDLVLFYFFFEAGLIPMFLIIGVWGGPRRVYAAFKFFLYTFTGSVLMLLAIMAIYSTAGTTDIPTLLTTHFPVGMQKWLWLAFFASFAVKIPMWPVHTWLPDAHVEAPTAGSVILAGVLLKMGGYGFIRISLPMFPDASHYFAPLIYALSVIAIVYTSMVALAQTDMKKLIAYSSIAHMGVVTLGLFTFNRQGLDGAMFQMLSHGIVSAALFLCVGVLYDRMHTHEIAIFGGLANRMPHYAFFFMAFTIAGMGLPATSSFVGEFLVLIGTLHVNFWLSLFGALGMVFGVPYSLYLYRWVMFGKLVKPTLFAIQDLTRLEIAVFVPLMAATLWMGIYPSSFSRIWATTATQMIAQYQDSPTAVVASSRDVRSKEALTK